ncbi:MAG: hypothetical protein ACE5GB_15290 [Acidimicrobiales bacterium]
MTDERGGTTRPTHVGYIDRTRAYYAALGHPRPYQWARHRDAPFAPLPRPLAECTVAVVTTAYPWIEAGPRPPKEVYSEPVEPVPERMYTADLAWDKETTHTDDVATFLPLVQLDRAARDGRIGALATRFHGVPTAYSRRRSSEEDAPEILARLRADRADVVMLVPL